MLSHGHGEPVVRAALVQWAGRVGATKSVCVVRRARGDSENCMVSRSSPATRSSADCLNQMLYPKGSL